MTFAADPPEPEPDPGPADQPADDWRCRYHVCLPVDAGARTALARTGRTVTPPGRHDVITGCAGCGTRIWVPPSRGGRTDIHRVCPACHRRHLTELGLTAVLAEALDVSGTDPC